MFLIKNKGSFLNTAWRHGLHSQTRAEGFTVLCHEISLITDTTGT
jgi:hypothetical protein